MNISNTSQSFCKNQKCQKCPANECTSKGCIDTTGDEVRPCTSISSNLLLTHNFDLLPKLLFLSSLSCSKHQRVTDLE